MSRAESSEKENSRAQEWVKFSKRELSLTSGKCDCVSRKRIRIPLCFVVEKSQIILTVLKDSKNGEERTRS
jgi:hypothetical protein